MFIWDNFFLKNFAKLFEIYSTVKVLFKNKDFDTLMALSGHLKDTITIDCTADLTMSIQ